MKKQIEVEKPLLPFGEKPRFRIIFNHHFPDMYKHYVYLKAQNRLAFLAGEKLVEQKKEV